MICYVMTHVMLELGLYNTCYVIKHMKCYVKTHDMLCHLTHVMLCYITHYVLL